MEENENKGAMEKKSSLEMFLRSLKCSICWEILDKPHTLRCGHSFCMRCIRRLAKLTRDQRRRMSFNVNQKIMFPCPSCRQLHGTGVLVKKKASVNFVMQEITDYWRKQLYDIKKEQRVEVRSVATQDSTNYSNSVYLEMEAEEDSMPYHISNTEYQYLMPRVPSHFLPQGNETNLRADSDPSTGNSSSGSESFSTDESDEFTYHVGPIVLRRPRNRLEQRRVLRGGVFGLYNEIYTTIGEIFSNPNRVIMCMVWLGYTISIMIIANSFFPYMMLYSLLFILILYAETMQDQGRQFRNT